MKFLVHILCIAVIGFGWFHYSQNHLSDEQIEQKLADYETELVEKDDDDLEEKVFKRQTELKADSDQLIFGGVLLSLLTAGYIGVVFVVYVLPMLAHRATQSVYDSTEDIGVDAMGDARSKLAQGDYDGAITAFYEAAHQNPMNRLPYVEIAKIQLTQQENPDAAIATLTQAIEGQAWEENDAAFLMFRLAEIYHDDKQDIPAANAVMQQVIDQFPATRHSANATHKMQEWAAGA